MLRTWGVSLGIVLGAALLTAVPATAQVDDRPFTENWWPSEWGADDKAGIAIVMTMAEHLLQQGDIRHGKLRICFTPDEEIGRGVHPDLPADLDADFAYTLDGGDVGEVVGALEVFPFADGELA